MPHLCEFVTKSPSFDCAAKPHKEILKKRKLDLSDDGANGQKHESKDSNTNIADEIHAPAPSSIDTFLYPILANNDRCTPATKIGFQDQVATAVLSVPPRYLCDALINNFVHNVNYIYYSVYPPVFLNDYAEWWTHRGATRDPIFTCLLLRVCAYSAQYLPEITRTLLETNLGEDVQKLSQRYHDAAEKLSSYIETGSGGLMHVQQLFLAAPWYKSECKFKKIWHALGTAIREGQEIGLHRDNLVDGTTSLETELRRRMWCLLYLWDFQVSSWLGRPLLIDQDSCSIVLPRSNLEFDENSNLPSPFAINTIQCELCLRLRDRFGARVMDANNCVLVLTEIKAWTNDFPSVFSLVGRERTCDKDHPWMRRQRLQLHAMVYKFKLDVLRPFLVRNDTAKFSAELETKMRDQAIETGLEAITVARQLFEIMFPANAKAYLFSCVGFEAAVTLAAAMIHNKGERLPHHHRCASAMETVLDMLRDLAGTTRLGATTYGILRSLVQSVPLIELEGRGVALTTHLQSPQHTYSRKLASLSDTNDKPMSGQVYPFSPQDDLVADTIPDFLLITNGTCETEHEPPVLQSLYVPTLSDFQTTNFAGLEDVWDWQDLHLSVSENADTSVQFQVT